MDDNKKKQKNEGEEVKEKTIKEDEKELLKQKIEELENQNKRILADYRNLEKRVDSQRRDWILEANKKWLAL